MPLHDLRIASRNLLRSPGFTLTAVLMLAFGIGATTAVFSVIECVILRPLPFPNSNRLVRLNDVIQGADVGNNGEAGVTGPDIQNYIRETHSFDGLGGSQQQSYELSGIGEPAQVNGARMSGGVFSALQVQPSVGRYFTQEEDDQKQQLVVLSYQFWRERMHSDRHVLGTKILLNRKPYEIIGVMPRNFEFPLVPGRLNQSEFWVPLSLTKDETGPNGAAGWNFDMIGRLKAGVTAAQAKPMLSGWRRRPCTTCRLLSQACDFAPWCIHCSKIQSKTHGASYAYCFSPLRSFC